MQVLILAAGYATRLYPLTKHWPKPLLLIKEKPIITHILEKVQKLKDVKKISVITNDKFFPYFREWAKISKFKKNIEVVNDRTTAEKNRLGAIGDISFFLKNYRVENDLLVVGGDNLFAFNLSNFVKFAKKKGGDCAVGLYRIKDPELIRRYGIATTNQHKKIIDFKEKPKKCKSNLISMCIYYLPHKNLKLVEKYLQNKKRRDAPGNYIKWLYKKTNVFGYEFKGTWYDIGDIVTFYHASVTFKD